MNEEALAHWGGGGGGAEPKKKKKKKIYLGKIGGPKK